jgi:hypothetical protein
MLTHRTDRRDADLRGATQMLSRTCELFVPNAEASARPATSCVIVCLLTCSPAHLLTCASVPLNGRLCRACVRCSLRVCSEISAFGTPCRRRGGRGAS